MHKPSTRPRHGRRKGILIGLMVLLLASAGIVLYLWCPWHKNLQATQKIPVVPAAISNGVSYKVYYPDPAKLPAGYTLVRSSFTMPVKNGVAYWVSYDNGKHIVFSVQSKPSDTELQTFNSNYIPLRNDYQTGVGQAEIGAYHNQTLVSLPATNGPWIVISAPQDISQDKLKQVLSSITK